MNKYASKIVVGIMAAVFGFLIAGCGTIGNGQIDIPVEIQVIYVDNLGNEYDVTVGPNGTSIYVSNSGNSFIEATDGMLSLTDPKTGTKVRVKRAN